MPNISNNTLGFTVKMKKQELLFTHTTFSSDIQHHNYEGFSVEELQQQQRRGSAN